MKKDTAHLRQIWTQDKEQWNKTIEAINKAIKSAEEAMKNQSQILAEELKGKVCRHWVIFGSPFELSFDGHDTGD